ncbi:hypothetical protein [Streptomyces sp. KN37]|nr:hypothetical protein [Streptomyces sp. KN37]WPO70026.1 hypothetical protein R9806_04990 [Streptomyces sp. KN37]
MHWVAGEEDGSPDHGSGRTGTTRPGPALTVASVVREGVEVRLAHADGLAPGLRVRMGGRPIAGDARPRAEAVGSGRAEAATAALRSTLTSLGGGFPEAGVLTEERTSRR